MSDYFMECYVRIYGLGDQFPYLGMGTDSVVTFAHLVDFGALKDAIKIERDFNCNRDVEIYGDKLIPFLEEYYPDFDRTGIEPSKIYSIYCYDMS